MLFRSSAVRSPSGLYEKKGGSSSSCISASALISVWLGALRWLVDSSATSVTGSGGKFSAYVIFAAYERGGAGAQSAG